MKDKQDGITRRGMLASSTSFATGGLLLTGSAAGAQGQTSKKNDGANGTKIEGLTDAVTIANGKAKVKGWAKESGKGGLTVSISGEESVTYTAREFANHINKGVEKGHWTVRKHADELSFNLTEKGREFFSDNSSQGLQTLSHCNGRNEIDGDTIYLNDESWEDVVLGAALTAGTLDIAAAIAGVINGLTVGTIVLAVAGVLASLGAFVLQQMNEGCGTKADADSLNAQHCDC